MATLAQPSGPAGAGELARCLFDKELWAEIGGNVGKRRRIFRCYPSLMISSLMMRFATALN